MRALMGIERGMERTTPSLPAMEESGRSPGVSVSLLTGGGDPHYAYGLFASLQAQGASIDLIGSDDFDLPKFRDKPGTRFLNLRGSVDSKSSTGAKVVRIVRYYARLILYAASAKPRIFHILWNNKFDAFDRTILMLYYKLLGKRIVFTAHNVNAGNRDKHDTLLNRVTLRVQYRLADHLFVHTEKMKQELIEEFGVRQTRVTVIPYGINNAVPNTSLTTAEARARLGIGQGEKVLLFFGRILPYKGLEYLVSAFRLLESRGESCRLLVAGRPDGYEQYWREVEDEMRAGVEQGRILVKAHFIPDDETELYFKAADVLVLPYRHIYQSGILYLGHSFGLPVIASDVGSFRDEIVEGRTGFVCKPEDASGLLATIDKYFESELYANLETRRRDIENYVKELHSWETVGKITSCVYAGLLPRAGLSESLSSGLSSSES